MSASRVAGPAVPVAVNVSGLPAIPVPDALALSVLVPAVGPRVQLPTVAMPLALVAVVLPVTDPLSDAAVKATAMFGTGLPYWSVTRTAGEMGTGVPTVAVCPSPVCTAMCAAGPRSGVAVKIGETGFCPLGDTARTSTLCVSAVEVPSVQ